MIATLSTIIYAIVFSVFFAIRNNYQKLERDNFYNETEAEKYREKWHFWQGAIQLTAALIIIPYCYFQPRLLDALLWLSIYWLLFDNLVSILQGTGIWYNGSGTIDKFFKKWEYGGVIKGLVQLTILAATIALYNFY